MAVSLYDHQLKAVENLRTGSVLVGGVGSGKSRTALGYFFKTHGGSFEPNYKPMTKPKDLYIITTARKRDDLEWDSELSIFLMSRNPDINFYDNKIVVDSWNNIKKYENVRGAFFVFDEQRVVGTGAWVKAFIKIARQNDWILLSATPGDTWLDYAPLFIANGFYKNISEFRRRHVIYSRYTKYPKVERYVDVESLIECRKRILVQMAFKKATLTHHEIIRVDYDRDAYDFVREKRKNPFNDNKPCRTISEYCAVLRRIVNTDPSRQEQLLLYFSKHPRLIVFYNFDYELEILRKLCEENRILVNEWNGHKHEPVPEADSWMYLVQYSAGSEAWNCITTDSMLFYSDNYSYKIMVQSSGRIDRMTTPFTDLYYAHLRSQSGIDAGIANCLAQKKKFNEKSFVKDW